MAHHQRTNEEWLKSKFFFPWNWNPTDSVSVVEEKARHWVADQDWKPRSPRAIWRLSLETQKKRSSGHATPQSRQKKSEGKCRYPPQCENHLHPFKVTSERTGFRVVAPLLTAPALLWQIGFHIFSLRTGIPWGGGRFRPLSLFFFCCVCPAPHHRPPLVGALHSPFAATRWHCDFSSPYWSVLWQIGCTFSRMRISKF